MTMLGMPVSFIATANATDSRHFYESVLNLKCVSDDPFALVFEIGSTTLRVQKVESVAEVEYTVLGWQVTDIQQSVRELSSKGAQFQKFAQLPQDALGIWSSPGGGKVAWFKDPDGNILSLTQL